MQRTTRYELLLTLAGLVSGAVGYLLHLDAPTFLGLLAAAAGLGLLMARALGEK